MAPGGPRRLSVLARHVGGGGRKPPRGPAAAPSAADDEPATSPFSQPQVRSKRIRFNSGAWNPLVDMTEVFAGNFHPVAGEGGAGSRFELQDGAVNVQLAVEPAAESEPLLVAEAPWETTVVPLFIWTTDDGEMRMLYECGAAGQAIATSRDGYRWKRPSLGLVEWQGQETNLLANGISGATGVFIDENPACPESERFKAVGGDMAYYDPDTLSVPRIFSGSVSLGFENHS